MEKRKYQQAFLGQGLAEYAIMIALLIVAVVGGLSALGQGTSNTYDKVASAFGTPTPVPPDLYPDDRITIKVIDARGEGIGNVPVYMFRSSGAYTRNWQRTDESGFVEFITPEDGAYRFRADLQGRQFWSDVISYPSEVFAVIQTDQMDFPVKVVDAAGLGIANIRVYAYTDQGRWAGQQGLTDNDGVIMLPMIGGKFKFRALYQANEFWSDVAILPTAKMALIQTGRKNLPVHVVDAAGNGIAGTRVYAYTAQGRWTGVTGKTGSDGVANLEIVAGNFKFRTYYQGHEYWSDVVGLHQTESVTIRTGQQPFPVKVVDASGNGIPNITVYAYTNNERWTGVRAKTGSDGVAWLDLAEGAFKFRAYYQAHTYWSDVVSVHQSGSATIQTEQSTFSVTVLDANGNGISGQRVYAYSNTDRWTGVYGTTNENGVVNLNMAAGNFKFRVHYQGYDFWSDTVGVPATVSTVIQTERNTFTVTVVSPDGTGLGNAYVYAYSSGGAWTGQSGRTNASGTVTFELVPGDFKFLVRYQAQSLESGIVSIPQVRATSVTLPLSSMTITVLDQNGAPRGNIPVYIYSDQGSYTGVWGRTAADGTLSVSLMQGNYRARVNQTWSKNFNMPSTSSLSVTVE